MTNEERAQTFASRVQADSQQLGVTLVPRLNCKPEEVEDVLRMLASEARFHPDLLAGSLEKHISLVPALIGGWSQPEVVAPLTDKDVIPFPEQALEPARSNGNK